jgi:hypothetical protein
LKPALQQRGGTIGLRLRPEALAPEEKLSWPGAGGRNAYYADRSWKGEVGDTRRCGFTWTGASDDL